MIRLLATCLFSTLLAACNISEGRNALNDTRDLKEAYTESESESVSTSDSDSPVTELEQVVSPEGLQEQILRRFAYTVSYNKNTRCPNWVAWHLTADHTTGPYKRDGLSFVEDEEVPSPRATNYDYSRSGYDRGHMCPSGDNKWNQTAQTQSFIYTNCCPQLHNLNEGDWNELEMKCRNWAEKYGEVWIACGPIFLNKTHKTIGKNKVVVPEAFFKVVLAKDGSGYKAIGFIYRNEKTDKHLSQYVNTIDDVERITGYDFFAALPDDVEKAVEATADYDSW